MSDFVWGTYDCERSLRAGLDTEMMFTILGKMLFGEEMLAKGSVILPQKKIRITNPEAAVKNGMAYISKDRDKDSLALDASIAVNVASTGLDANRTHGIFSSAKKEKAWVDTQVKNLKIKCNSKYDPVRSLSGGNKQKVAFGKWFARNADILILDCPTRGIDIGVKQELYRLMYEIQAIKGVLFLLIVFLSAKRPNVLPVKAMI